MNARRDRQKQQNNQQNKQLEAQKPPAKIPVDHRKEKLADFLIDVAKYVFTGVIIT